MIDIKPFFLFQGNQQNVGQEPDVWNSFTEQTQVSIH